MSAGLLSKSNKKEETPLELNRSIQFSDQYVDRMEINQEEVRKSLEDVRRSLDVDKLAESREDLKESDVRSIDIDDQLEKLDIRKQLADHYGNVNLYENVRAKKYRTLKKDEPSFQQIIKEFKPAVEE